MTRPIILVPSKGSDVGPNSRLAERRTPTSPAPFRDGAFIRAPRIFHAGFPEPGSARVVKVSAAGAVAAAAYVGIFTTASVMPQAPRWKSSGTRFAKRNSSTGLSAGQLPP